MVDDGSTDGSTDIALRYSQQYPEKVRYLDHIDHRNQGAAASRNLGIAQARGEFVAFLDADDVWLPGKLQRQVAIMERHPDVGLVFNRMFFWYEDGNKVPKPITLSPGMHPSRAWLTEVLANLDHASAGPSAVMVRKDLAIKVGGFEESLKGVFQLFEDAAAWFKFGMNAPFYYDPECMSLHRLHSSSCWGRSSPYEQIFARLHLYSWLVKYLKRHDHGQFQSELYSAKVRFHTALIRYLVEMEQIEAAAALVHSLEQQLPRPPEDAEWNYLAAFCKHIVQIDLQEALNQYDRALEYGYEEFWVKYNRGSLHAQLGNLKEAREDLERAVELNPDHEGARQVLRQLSPKKDKNR